MCTMGALNGRYLCKTRDLWHDSEPREEIVRGRGRLRYLGVRGHAAPGERGLNSGINEAGVAVAITFADTVPLTQALRQRTPRGVLVEEILAACGDLSSALQRLAEFQRVPLVGGNIIIMTRQGGVVLEQLFPRFCIEQIMEEVTVRTNHFLNLTEPEPLVGDRENSVARLRRMTALLGNGRDMGIGQLQGMLADHHGPHQICSHQGELRTVSAVVYDLTAARLLHAAGSPCNTNWQEFRQ